jgi:hypothetical protein
VSAASAVRGSSLRSGVSDAAQSLSGGRWTVLAVAVAVVAVVVVVVVVVVAADVVVVVMVVVVVEVDTAAHS